MLFRSRAPKGKRFNLTILRYVWRYRWGLRGVYYFDDIDNAVPVLDVDVDLPRQFFEEVDESALRKAPRMVCLPRCGACCEVASGVFAFIEELEELRALGFDVHPRKCERIKLMNGEVVKVCEVAKGRCPLYDAVKRSCLAYSSRPVICRVVYCTLVAELEGRLLIKVLRKKRTVFVPYAGSIEDLAQRVRDYMIKLLSGKRCAST